MFSAVVIKKETVKLCESCLLGKGKKLSYGSGKHTSTKPLDYCHSDLWGPSSEKSTGGGKYFLSIIDDISRKVWVWILKDKSEAFEKFKTWCKAVEVEKGYGLKCLRTDNGLEFVSKEFDTFCKLRGIKRHHTAPRNPQQNGTIEHLNRTLLERVRCCDDHSRNAKEVLGIVASTAAKVINKCPSSAIDHDTPGNRWCGSLAGYQRLRVFGCRAFAHIRQGKLEPRALRCIFLGYQDGVKGYRLWCTESGNQKIIISRYVVFDESTMPYMIAKQNGAPQQAPTQPISHLEQNFSQDLNTETSAQVEEDEEEIDSQEKLVQETRLSRLMDPLMMEI